MPMFLVIQKSTGEIVHTYASEEMTAVCGLDIPGDDLAQKEMSDQEFSDYMIKEHYKTVEPDLDKALQDTDWSQLPDSGLSPEKVLEFRQYRASIRSIKESAKLGAPVVDVPIKPTKASAEGVING